MPMIFYLPLLKGFWLVYMTENNASPPALLLSLNSALELLQLLSGTPGSHPFTEVSKNPGFHG